MDKELRDKLINLLEKSNELEDKDERLYALKVVFELFELNYEITHKC